MGPANPTISGRGAHLASTMVPVVLLHLQTCTRSPSESAEWWAGFMTTLTTTMRMSAGPDGAQLVLDMLQKRLQRTAATPALDLALAADAMGATAGSRSSA